LGLSLVVHLESEFPRFIDFECRAQPLSLLTEVGWTTIHAEEAVEELHRVLEIGLGLQCALLAEEALSWPEPDNVGRLPIGRLVRDDFDAALLGDGYAGALTTEIYSNCTDMTRCLHFNFLYFIQIKKI
jgi:hypothetical protein